MNIDTGTFRQQARIAIEDIRLAGALENATGHFSRAREAALQQMPGADAMRDHFKQVRSATLRSLGTHLETFERQARANGTHVHWAQDSGEACRIVTELAQARGIRLVTKSKSMATEEIRLNHALEQQGVIPVETDLGEWIVQLAGEAPSHIIAPAIHKTKEQVAELFEAESGEKINADIPELTATARVRLREHFLSAGMGISGGNILVAETGSVVLVTNEGNGRMVTSLPPVHIAIVGLEKIAPTWNEAAVWLSLLARSATGQPLSIYTSIITGPAQPGDPDGPEEVHVVVLDNGRSRLLGTPYEEVLQCIRCGACLNVCPVYRTAGGHAYGSPYSGPIGAVISPLLFGLENFEALPQASSLCGACLDVCPVRIDLPRMLLELRTELVSKKILPWSERTAERAAAKVFGSVKRLNLTRTLLKIAQAPVKGKLTHHGRAVPDLADRSFRELWEELKNEP